LAIPSALNRYVPILFSQREESMRCVGRSRRSAI
jgi:hypothetical protein